MSVSVRLFLPLRLRFQRGRLPRPGPPFLLLPHAQSSSEEQSNGRR
jgi:hypothetical protein